MTLRLLEAEDVAQMLAVSVARVYELARVGLIPSVRLGRQVRFSECELDAWARGGGRGLAGNSHIREEP